MMKESQDESDEKQLLSSLLKIIKEKDLSDSIYDGKREYSEDYISQLKVVSKNFQKNEPFQIGQIVKWKKNLKNRKLPYENQPAIVVELLAEPITTDEHDSGSPYFREPLDIVLGLLDDENTFLTFYYDSRRFEAY